jgi:hypothetical protein
VYFQQVATARYSAALLSVIEPSHSITCCYESFFFSLPLFFISALRQRIYFAAFS